VAIGVVLLLAVAGSSEDFTRETMSTELRDITFRACIIGRARASEGIMRLVVEACTPTWYRYVRYAVFSLPEQSGQASNALPAPAPSLSPPPPPPRSFEGGIGDTIAFSDSRFVVARLTDRREGMWPVPSSDSARHVALDVLFESTSDFAGSFSAYDISLSDESGYQYNAISIGGTEPTLPLFARSFAPHERIRGWVTFDLPDTAKGLVFHYRAARIRLGR